MYYLDFTTILQLLKEFQCSGVLETELPKGIVNTHEPCRLQCKLLQGEITGYHIIAGFGEMIVVDEDVLRQVETLGPLEWTFGPWKGSSASPMKYSDHTSSSPALTSSISPFLAHQPYVNFLALVPHRLATREHSSLRALTRRQRRVLALVDGRRNVGQIASLLFGSSTIERAAEVVLILLQNLEARNLIVLG
jgi:hypothetical protein